MHITEKSDLQLKFGFYRDAGQVTWDVSQVVAGDDKDSSTFFTIARHMQPVKQLDDKYQSRWEKIAQRQYPYNKSAFFDNKRTLIGDTYGHNLTADALAKAPVLYTAFYVTDGNVEQKLVQTKLDHFMGQLKVIEGLQ